MQILPGALADATLAILDRMLTPLERAAAARHRDPADRRRRVVGRAALRLLLGRATGRDPQTLELASGRHGKPLLPGGPAFNLSHGGDVVLLAFARDTPVGVDVEPLAQGAAWREVAPLLHPAEQAGLALAPDPAATFLRLWTRKEAVAKASGLGLSVPLDRWAVDTGARGVLVPPPGTPAGTVWWLTDLDPAPGHVGALAAQQRSDPLCWRFDPAGWAG